MAVRVRFPSRAQKPLFYCKNLSLFTSLQPYFCTMCFRPTVYLTLLLFWFASCNQSSKIGRYIAETDTNYTQDIRDISAKINKDPGNADLHYKRGNTFYYQKKYQDASLDFQSAVMLDSQNAMYHFRFGETILMKDTADPLLAMKHLRKATKLKKSFYEAEFALAKLFLYRQMYADAKKGLESLLEISEYADKANFYIGVLHKEQKDTARAMAFFEKALQINPQQYNAVMQIALLKANKGEDIALKYFDRALAINEFSDEALYGKGFYLQQHGNYSDAVKCYDQARLLNPQHILALYNTAFISLANADYTKCIDLCNSLVQLNPNFGNAYALRGEAHLKLGNKKAALENYNAALKIDPNNIPAKTGIQEIKGN